jgi:hypothetical protein
MNESPTATAAQARYIDAAEAAKMIRAELKRVFKRPGRFFSVRTDKYAGGASIDIRWTDGPTSAEVDSLVRGFSGKRFEGMTDCSYYADSWYCRTHGARVALTEGCDVASNNGVHASRCCSEAELVHFGSGYVFSRRELSVEFSAELAAQVRKESGMPAEGSNEDEVPGNSIHAYGSWTRVWDAIHRLSRDIAR